MATFKGGAMSTATKAVGEASMMFTETRFTLTLNMDCFADGVLASRMSIITPDQRDTTTPFAALSKKTLGTCGPHLRLDALGDAICHD
jgi:hypothetical protein